MRRALRILGRILVGTLVLALLMVGLLLVPAIRGSVLGLALDQARDRLPGSLTVASATWPSPGRVRLEGIRWEDPDGQRALSGDAEVAIRLRPLWSRTVATEQLTVDSLRVDVPRLRAMFPPSPDPAPAEAASDPWALDLQGIDLQVGASPLDSTHTLDHLRLRGTVHADPGGTVQVDVAELAIAGDDATWGMRSGGLRVDPVERVVEGSAEAWWHGDPAVQATVTAQGRRTLEIRATILAAADSTHLDWESRLDFSEDMTSVRVTGEGSVRQLHHPALAGLPPGIQRALREATVRLRGDASTRAPWTASGSLAAGLPDGTLRAVAHWNDGRARLDSLGVVLPGLRAHGEGDWSGDTVTGHLDLTTDDPAWVEWITGESPPEVAWDLTLRAEATGPAADPEVDARLTGSARAAGRDVESVSILARTGAARTGDWDTSVAFQVDDIGLAVRATVATGPPLLARVSPIVLRKDRVPALPTVGSGRIEGEGTRWTVRDVRVQGDLGTLDVSGEWSDATAQVDASLVTAPLAEMPGELPPAVTSLGPVLAKLSARLDPRARTIRSGVVDLSETDWLDTARAQLDGSFSAPVLDTLIWSGLGLRLDAGGTLDPEALDLRFRADADTTLLARFAPGALDSLVVRLDGRILGTTTSPELRAELAGTLTQGATQVDSLMVRAEGGLGSLTVGAEAVVRGVEATGTVRVRAAAEVDSVAARPRATVDLAATSLRGAWHQRSRVEGPGPWIVTTDSMRIQVRDLSWSTPQAFVVRADTNAIQLEGLELAGTLGSLSAAGTWSPRRIALEAEGGFRVPWEGPDLDVGFTANTGADSLRTRVFVREAETERLQARMTLPIGAGEPLANASVEGSLDCLPLPLGAAWNHPVRRWVCADGEFRVDQLGSRPGGSLGVEVRVLDVPALENHRLRLDAEGGIQDAGGAYRVAADLRLTGPNGPILTGQASAAADSATADPRIEATLEGSSINLTELGALLPPDMDLTGNLSTSIQIEGPSRNPSLEGSIRGPLGLSTAEGNRISGRLDLAAEGTRQNPRVSGELQVDRGQLRIPEAPKALHPTDGDALLWSTRVDADVPPPAPPRDPLPVPEVEVDVRVEIPGGLWIRGRGLEAELVGALEVDQREGEARVDGELEARRGSLLLLGRTFSFQRGGVTFEGGDPANPTLDMVLATNVNTVLIRVLFSGPAQNPVLSLESEPELPEGDIVSYLLFGRPVGELDSGQSDLLETRATEIAASLGIANLEALVARQLGVDMVRIRRQDGESSLLLGKYLSPKILLQYEQGVDAERDTRLNLEYQLTRGFKIDTLFGRESQSGIGLTWERNY